MSIDSMNGPRRSRIAHAILAGLVVGAGLVMANASMAQQKVFSPGALVWADGGCSICHNAIGQGGTTGEAPPGPNLWRSKLNRDQLKETISCGRDTTQMPYHLIGAFKTRACWGRPLGDPPDTASGGAELTEAQIEELTNFLVETVVGKEPITKAKCGAFFGSDPAHAACARYP